MLCDARKRCQYASYMLDMLLYLLVLVPLLLSLSGRLHLERGQFSCNDTSIRLQYRGDTVSTKLLLSLLFIPPLFIVFLTELFHEESKKILRVVRGAALRTGQIYLRYWLASTFNIAINDILKVLIAAPRPHFMDSCQPDWSQINCSLNGGVVDFSRQLCQSEDTKMVLDSMKSFPSGHSQLTTFTAIFLMVYVEKRIGETYSVGWKRVLQLILMSFPVYCSTSRLLDQRHHVADVLTGALIGALVGFVASWPIPAATESIDRKEEPPVQKQGKLQRPSKIRLLSDFGSVAEAERELDEVNSTY